MTAAPAVDLALRGAVGLTGSTTAVPAVTAVPRDPAARLVALLDPDPLLTRLDGVVLAAGRVHGLPVHAFATDPAVQGGALGRQSCAGIVASIDAAVSHQVPVVGLWQSGGARLGEGVASLDGVARIFAAQVRASGVVPQLSVVLGPAAGGAAYGPALTDLVIAGPDARVFVTGPDVVRAVTGEDLDAAGLGGPAVHRGSGVLHAVAPSDPAALGLARTVLGLLGRPAGGPVPVPATPPVGCSLRALVPTDPRRAYDMRPVLRGLLDAGSAVELQPGFAPNVLTWLGRLGGRTVGVVANQPLRMAGCLDAAAGDKAGRFVQWCDTRGLPLVFCVDVPGYLPGLNQERDGVVRRGAKLLHAYAAAQVPRVTVVLRKAYGGAFIAMGSKGLGADTVLAWPGAQLDVMGAAGAVPVLHRRRLAAETDPVARAALQAELVAAHAAQAGGTDAALAAGVLDAVIDPDRTRDAVLAALTRAGRRSPVTAPRRNPPL